MSKNWRLREQQEWQDRGLTEPDYARDLHDPFLFKDMDKAAARILAAIAAGEKIVIFGDYDADGVPGSAILALFFNEIGFTNYDVYIPDRHNEEHGLSLVMVEKLISLGARLIITVDCGITDVKEVKRANELGVAVIITDHHLPGAELPPALAVIDAQRADNTYPFKWLCGAGVAFKLVQALVAVPARTVLKDAPRTVLFEKVPSGWEKWLLDLVAIATVSDMVPLVGENRALVHFGLKVLRKSPRVGLAHLFRELKLKQEFITEDDIGFMIGPRINTASRMSHASQAFFLLTTDDETRAGAIARHLEEKNRERRDQVDLILADLDARLSLGGLASKSLIVAGNENWSLGVLGLAASRVVEKYERPVFLWARNGHGLI
ncbi:MAG: DHH family phosphoesterase, partial [Candidatus Vogelbacteria bacterium]|nr:DHH family phosphoesterase [Candidatus Vogelbacteria bacterium]